MSAVVVCCRVVHQRRCVGESTSPWASALVPAFKKGGSIRWAVDYRGLNKVTIADAYPLPSIEENLERLQGSTIYSTMDAAAAYHTIAVKEKVRPYLAFITPGIDEEAFSTSRMSEDEFEQK